MTIRRRRETPTGQQKTEADLARELAALSDEELEERMRENERQIKLRVAAEFGFFTGCARRRCRRQRACRGNPSWCFARSFPLVPDRALARWGRVMDVIESGLSPEAAGR